MSESVRETVISVVLADDHAVVLRGLSAFFEMADDIQVVASVSTGAEAVAMVELHQPVVLLLDLLLPDQSAIDTISGVRAVSPETRVVILTSHKGDEYFDEVLNAGALSYILKDSSPEDLMMVVRKAALKQSVLDAHLAKAIINGCDSKGRELHSCLTEREREVTRLIARGLTNREIAATLFISETTVKSHVSSILGKLYLDGRTKLAAYAWEQGLVKNRGCFTQKNPD